MRVLFAVVGAVQGAVLYRAAVEAIGSDLVCFLLRFAIGAIC